MRLYHSVLVRTPTLFFFFFNDTATTEIYTLSLHDALPISPTRSFKGHGVKAALEKAAGPAPAGGGAARSEEHTSELQSRLHLVCRLLLEKKKKNNIAAVSVRQLAFRPLLVQT